MTFKGIVQASVEAVKGKAPKEEKKEWKPGNKKEKKLEATKRNQVKVEVAKQEEILNCEQQVNFAQTFNTHILQGEVSGQTHVGYHSEVVVNFANFGACAITNAVDGNNVYTGTCTMNGRQNPKLSTFFPATWDINRIRTEVAHAYCHPVDRGGIQGGNQVEWCGNAQTNGLLIGGRGPGHAITTAFPAYNGGFV